MSVVMQIIHHNHPELRYRQFACIPPVNVDDYHMNLRTKPFA